MPHSAHIVYRGADVRAWQGQCIEVDTPAAAPQDTPQAPVPGTTRVADLGIDCSNAYFNIFNRNEQATVNAIFSSLNAINVIYIRDVGIRHRISSGFIRTSSFYTSSNPSTILNQFRNPNIRVFREYEAALAWIAADG